MSLEQFSKIPGLTPLLQKLSRRLAKMFTAEIEANFFKERFQEEVKRRCELEEQIIRNNEKQSQEVSKISREAVRIAVRATVEIIKEEYYLVPKKPVSLHNALLSRLGKPNTVLGQIPPSPPENKAKG